MLNPFQYFFLRIPDRELLSHVHNTKKAWTHNPASYTFCFFSCWDKVFSKKKVYIVILKGIFAKYKNSFNILCGLPVAQMVKAARLQCGRPRSDPSGLSIP